MSKGITLDNQVALVAGGSGGLGQAISIKLASFGAKVVINYFLGKRAADTVVEEISNKGFHAIALKADITVAADVERMFSLVLEEFGKINILVNAAGINPVSVPVVDLKETDWNLTLDVNLKGPFLCCKYVAPIMIRQRQGRIINISSIFGKNSPALRAAYGASKHGLIGLTQTLAKEMAPYNVTVNAIRPGPVNTQMVREIFAKTAKEMGTTTEEYYQERTKEIPLGRLGDPEDIANLVAFLASDMASYITGAVIDITGGI